MSKRRRIVNYQPRALSAAITTWPLLNRPISQIHLMQSEYATKSLYRDDAEVDGVRNDDVITASGKVLEKAHDIEYVATCYRV